MGFFIWYLPQEASYDFLQVNFKIYQSQEAGFLPGLTYIFSGKHLSKLSETVKNCQKAAFFLITANFQG